MSCLASRKQYRCEAANFQKGIWRFQPLSPESEVGKRQRMRAETVVQEVRLRNFDDVLMDPRELFN